MVVFINLSKNKNYKTKNMVFFSFFYFLHNTYLLYFSRIRPTPHQMRPFFARLPCCSTPPAHHHQVPSTSCLART